MGTSFSKNIFVKIVESLSIPSLEGNSFPTEGIVTSLNEFLDLISIANNIYCNTFKIPDADKLVFAEDVPSDLVHKLNNGTTSLDITSDTLRDLRIVTYTADEKPAVISSRKTNDYDGIRSIKWRLIDEYPDPDYTGYTIARLGKDVEVDISFHVWGTNFEDIRKRGALLRDIVDTNVWFFKHKGLRDIIWRESQETRLWDGKSIMKEKIESYLVRYTQVKLVRQKNLEQMAIEFALEEPKKN
jgi:hypothetical protein